MNVHDKFCFFSTVNVNGIDALILTPKIKKMLKEIKTIYHGRGFNFLLNSLSSKINCLTSYPSIYIPNILNIKNQTDLVKFNLSYEANNILEKENNKPYKNQLLNFFYFLFVIFMILFCTFLGFYFSETKGVGLTNDAKTGIGPEDPTGDLKTFRTN